MSPRGTGLMLLAVALMALALFAAADQPASFFRAYLFAWLMLLGVALGAFSLLCVHHLVGGRWGAAIRPQLAAATRTLPALALLFIPIALGLRQLYPWTEPAFLAADPLRAAKAPYLDPTLFLARSSVTLLAWCLLARPLARPGPLRPGLAGLALLVYLFTITTATLDWLLSLDPDMSTSAIGLDLATGDAVAGLSFVLLVATCTPARVRLTPERTHELGNLLLAALMLWAYIAFSQYLLVWSADLPRQAAWYITRTQGPWWWCAWAMVTLHFALPFVLLLFRPIKRRRSRLAAVAALLLLMRLVELAWLIFPTRPVALHWLDPALLLALGALWFAAFLRHLSATEAAHAA